MTDLKPCPFCGAEMTINNAGLGVHPRFSACLLAQHSVVTDDESQARRWNTRAAERAGGAVDQGMVERMAAWLFTHDGQPVVIGGADGLYLPMARAALTAALRADGEGREHGR